MIDFKEQYKGDIKQTSISYNNDDLAIKRVEKILATNRNVLKIHSYATTIWESFFMDVFQDRNNIPVNNSDFNQWHKAKTLLLSAKIKNCLQDNLLHIGHAQKYLNLFLKDLWAFNQIDNVENLLHIPLDRILLKRFKLNRNSRWVSWTKVSAKDKKEFDKLYCEYEEIQDAFRGFSNKLDFKNPISLEQIYWHRIESNYKNNKVESSYHLKKRGETEKPYD